MKDNIYDIAMEKASKRINNALDKINKDFKGVKPFDKEPVSNDDMLLNYNTPGYVENIDRTQGRQAANDFIYEVYKIKKRRGVR